MAQRKIDMNILNSVKKYIEEINKYYKTEAVFIFGSYAKGNEHIDSDIDVAIVSADFTDKYDDMAKLIKLTWNIDTRIEPHPIKPEEYRKKDYFVKEIIDTGIKIA